MRLPAKFLSKSGESESAKAGKKAKKGEGLARDWREFAKSSELLELSERPGTIKGTEGT